MLYRILIAILAIASFIAGIYYGGDIKFEHQWTLYEALRTTASIVFAVAGAWIAIIYPERLKAPFKGEKTQIDGSLKHYSSLFSPIVNSIFILCIVLIVGILAPILKQIPVLLEYKHTLRACSYGLLMILTYCQIWTVFITIFPASLLHSEANKAIYEERMNQRYKVK
ncbi:hypothetical protein [Pasteurella multocida]|uniref:hypothetical protein n=1 Tax=Pasteurella multocida TaxID=747 RepID=UPI00397E036B